LAPGPTPGSVLVYDLRVDPTPFLKAAPTAQASLLFADRETMMNDGFTPLPVKQLAANKCPAVAPTGVLDEQTCKRLVIDLNVIQHHRTILQAHPEFARAVGEAFEMREPFERSSDVEFQLYDGFGNDKDVPRMIAVREANVAQLNGMNPNFSDNRLSELLVRYKARNYPQSLSDGEREQWEAYRTGKLRVKLPAYMETLSKLAASSSDTFLLEELQLWAESIVPFDA
jgi:exodeoxyribonuclease-1